MFYLRPSPILQAWQQGAADKTNAKQQQAMFNTNDFTPAQIALLNISDEVSKAASEITHDDGNWELQGWNSGLELTMLNEGMRPSSFDSLVSRFAARGIEVTVIEFSGY